MFPITESWWSMADGRVVIDTGLDTSGFEKGVKGLPSKMGGITSSLKGIAAAAVAAFSVKAIADFGKEAIELGSNIAEVQNVVDTAFGDMAYKVEAFSNTAIEQFGMSTLSAKKTASTYMAMAKGMGLTDGVASDMAINLAGLTGDVASFYNISQDLADTKLKSVFTGETETLKDLGVVMTQANLEAYAMKKGITKSMDAMSQAELVGLRYSYVMDSLSLAQGDFAKTSGSWANQTRILSENWKEFMSVVGQGLIQVLTPLLQILNQIVSSLTALVKGLLPSVGDSAESMSNAASGAETIASGLASANDAAKELKKTTAGFDEMTILSSETGQASIGGASAIATPSLDFKKPDTSDVKKASNEVKGIFEKLESYITTNFAPTISSWGTAFSGLKVPVTEAMTSVWTSLTTLWHDTLLPFGGYLAGEFVPNITNAFSEIFAPIFGQIMPMLFEEFSKDFDFACGEISRISADILQPAFAQAEIVAVDVFDGIKKSWDEHGAGILKGFQTFRDSLKNIWDEVYGSIIKPVVDIIGGKLSELWKNHLKPLWDNISNFLGSLAEFLLTVWNEVLSPLVNYIIDWIAPKIQRVIEHIWSVISTVWGMISDVIGGILKALGGLMDFITGAFQGDWKKAWTGIKDFFVGIWDAVWGAIKGIINLIIDGINMLWEGIYRAVKGIVDAIGGVAGALGKLFGQDWKFSMPAKPPLIPKLAQGAVLPPNRPFLAMVGDQRSGTNVEAPLSTIEEAVENVLNRRGGDGPYTIVLQVGSQRLGSVVLKSLKDASRQNGGLALDLR